jgi:hypothetical protein
MEIDKDSLEIMDNSQKIDSKKIFFNEFANDSRSKDTSY